MALITCYDPLPIAFTHGEGSWLFDEHGKAYLDSFSGIAVCGLGHAHPEVTKTIQTQAAKLMHVSNGFIIKEQQLLAERLTKLTGLEQAFFANSGAEANEAAIKLSRLYGHKKEIELPSIIVMDHAFHGRSMATLTASGSRKVQAGFEPLVSGFIRAPFNDIETLKSIAQHRNDVIAIMLEPIQGEGGLLVAEDAYLQAVAQLCKTHDWLLILDEVQTGNGRTGEFFAYMHTDIQPDILTTAKGLANGFPVSACLIGEKVQDLFKPGNHGSTFGGNPLAMATALTVLDVIERDKLCERARVSGAWLKERLMQELGEETSVKAIRGRGLMLGLELDRPAKDLKSIGLANGILINVTAEKVVRLLPPLIISDSELETLVSRLCTSIKQFLHQDTKH